MVKYGTGFLDTYTSMYIQLLSAKFALILDYHYAV